MLISFGTIMPNNSRIQPFGIKLTTLRLTLKILGGYDTEIFSWYVCLDESRHKTFLN